MNSACNSIKSNVFMDPDCTISGLLSRFFSPAALRSYLAEFISSFLFVLATVGSTVASQKGGIPKIPASSDTPSLVAVSLAATLAMSAAVYMAFNTSGGHVNPAVTFGMAIGGRMTVPTAIFYISAQLLAAVAACIVIRVTIVGQVPVYGIAAEMTGFGGSILEGVMTFTVVYTVYAVGDVRRGRSCGGGGIGAMVIGMVVGANMLVGGPFTGGCMNPATAFGTSIVGGSFRNHAVYWVGPFLGSASAALVFDNLIFPSSSSSDSVRIVTETMGV